ncbi:MAG: hypothetical protein A2527_01680 [Candidatus Lambdaproteobacteria bacterium RIFOXYD2_FULL_50_16]|uniref:Uncharacterized protein n=1 Tax=Candidatus Lambdaproteobacteria bacterium RIFOXYD2_FULL_50_16 TaxID=1817772 RepID=A0A1F6G5S5_9PROT|nr:MAG: hypothetical protein A2527_01680 [Candidatus Lambdaproteobacteria bacterium RIFOXYD2_FULL_50_16]
MAKILFLQDIEYEYIGPAYLSSAVKSGGHDCKLLVGTELQAFDAMITEFQPDLVAFSIMTGSHLWAIKMAGLVKKKYGIGNIFGGPHPTFFPELMEHPEVDMLVRGEGEWILLEIMNRLDRGQDFAGIGGLIYRNGDQLVDGGLESLPQDLDELPFPDWHLYDCLEGKIDRTVRTVLTSRGCPYKCTFCFQDAMRQMYKTTDGKFVRLREIDRVIAECKQLIAQTEVSRIYIRDDIFGLNRKWLYEFLECYKNEVGIEFMCLVRADKVAIEPEYAQRLADAGCKTVFWGIESGDEETRNRILKKKLSNESVIKAAQYLHDAGIKFLTFNIVGLPGESLAQAMSTLELNIAIKADYPWCSLYMPLPGTDLTNYAIEHEFLDQVYASLDQHGSFYEGTPIKGENMEAIENLQRFFQTAVLMPWTYPLIKRLIYLKPNKMFKYWFALVYFYVHVRSESRGFFQTLAFAIRNYRHVLGG